MQSLKQRISIVYLQRIFSRPKGKEDMPEWFNFVQDSVLTHAGDRHGYDRNAALTGPFEDAASASVKVVGEPSMFLRSLPQLALCRNTHDSGTWEAVLSDVNDLMVHRILEGPWGIIEDATCC